jgi:hypothetical protein
LTSKLNASGGPVKDVTAWKKVSNVIAIRVPAVKNVFSRPFLIGNQQSERELVFSRTP